jgi:hypothetical protein
VNPLGDEALALLPEWWRSGACVHAGATAEADTGAGATADAAGPIGAAHAAGPAGESGHTEEGEL